MQSPFHFTMQESNCIGGPTIRESLLKVNVQISNEEEAELMGHSNRLLGGQDTLSSAQKAMEFTLLQSMAQLEPKDQQVPNEAVLSTCYRQFNVHRTDAKSRDEFEGVWASHICPGDDLPDQVETLSRDITMIGDEPPHLAHTCGILFSTKKRLKSQEGPGCDFSKDPRLIVSLSYVFRSANQAATFFDRGMGYLSEGALYDEDEVEGAARIVAKARFFRHSPRKCAQMLYPDEPRQKRSPQEGSIICLWVSGNTVNKLFIASMGGKTNVRNGEALKWLRAAVGRVRRWQDSWNEKDAMTFSPTVLPIALRKYYARVVQARLEEPEFLAAQEWKASYASGHAKNFKRLFRSKYAADKGVYDVPPKPSALESPSGRSAKGQSCSSPSKESSSSPSGCGICLAVGQRVAFCDLRSRSDLNSREAVVEALPRPGEERYHVRVVSGNSEIVAVRLVNLLPVSPVKAEGGATPGPEKTESSSATGKSARRRRKKQQGKAAPASGQDAGAAEEDAAPAEQEERPHNGGIRVAQLRSPSSSSYGSAKSGHSIALPASPLAQEAKAELLQGALLAGQESTEAAPSKVQKRVAAPPAAAGAAVQAGQCEAKASTAAADAGCNPTNGAAKAIAAAAATGAARVWRRCGTCGVEVPRTGYSKRVWKMCKSNEAYVPTCNTCRGDDDAGANEGNGEQDDDEASPWQSPLASPSQGAVGGKAIEAVVRMGYHSSLVQQLAAAIRPLTEVALLERVKARHEEDPDCGICFFPFEKERAMILRPCCGHPVCCSCDACWHGSRGRACAFCRSETGPLEKGIQSSK